MTKIIGLTGRSGAGKGVATEIFAKYGIQSIDTDAVYHDILAKHGPCTDELCDAFGNGILGENGLVDRKKLSAIVFGNENAEAQLHTLNAITHKYIMADTRELVRAQCEANAPAVIIDAPQLFEAGVDRECDIVLGILAPRAKCLDRITDRDRISSEKAAQRLAAQHDNTFFKERCDAVIENIGDMQQLEAAICQFLKEYGIR